MSGQEHLPIGDTGMSPMVTNSSLPPPRKMEMKRKSSNAGSSIIMDKRPEEHLVDPNEPTYCICNQVSYGAMIGCDNEDVSFFATIFYSCNRIMQCEIEWFHYDCVGLDSPPKGKWYCEDCKNKLGIE